MKTKIALEYPPPFDGNGDTVEIVGEWVEFEGADVRVDVRGDGDPEVVASREQVTEDCRREGDKGCEWHEVGKHPVTVWRHHATGKLYGRLVVSADVEANVT